MQIIVDRPSEQAESTRAQIRLPLDNTTRMVIAVADPETGDILGLFRMPDSTIFSIDVAVAKSRNVSYYNNPAQLQTIDRLPGIPVGTAFSARTFRYLVSPFFPEGITGNPPGPFSILNVPGTNPVNGLEHDRATARVGLLQQHHGSQRLLPRHQLPRPVQPAEPERHRLLPGRCSAVRRREAGRRARCQRRRRGRGRCGDGPAVPSTSRRRATFRRSTSSSSTACGCRTSSSTATRRTL